MSDRPEWHAARRKGIGASESAAVLGESPWSSAYEVWARKTGRLDDVIHDPAALERMEVGTVLESAVLELYARRRGVETRAWAQGEVKHHRDFPVVPMLCTPDAEEVEYHDYPEELGGGGGSSPIAGIEIKTSLGWGSRQVWGDGPPLAVQIQAQHQLACTGLPRCTVVVLRTGPRVEWWDLERNDRFITALETTLTKWWADYVVADTPPPVDASAATVRALEALHEETGEVVELPDDAVAWDDRLVEIASDLDALKDEKEELRNRLRAAIGDATFGRLPGRQEGYKWAKGTRGSRVLRRLKKL